LREEEKPRDGRTSPVDFRQHTDEHAHVVRQHALVTTVHKPRVVPWAFGLCLEDYPPSIATP
jgi:hypothetical protein